MGLRIILVVYSKTIVMFHIPMEDGVGFILDEINLDPFIFKIPN